MSRGKRAFLLIVVVAAIAALVLLLPVREWALALMQWTRGAGVGGAVVYALAYIAATLLLIPGWVLTAGAGFVYGPWLGGRSTT